MAIADTITSMQTHTSNAYTMIGYGTDLTGINKNLANLSSTIFEAFLESLRNPDTLFTNLPKKTGTGANITLNDTANAPMRIELGASELQQRNLPSEYTQVDYLTASGTQYINTGYTPVQNDEMEIKNITLSGGGAIFFAGNGTYQFGFLKISSTNYFKYFGTGNASSFNYASYNNSTIKINQNGDIYVDGIYKANSPYTNALDGNLTSLNLFRRVEGSSYMTGSIGEVTITNGTTTKLHLIPCYRNSDNVVGYYNLVDNNFLTNAGTGTFTYGAIATPTPSSPQDIHTISGSNKVVVSNSDNSVSQEQEVDLGDIEYCKIGNYEDKIFKNIPSFTEYDNTLEEGAWYIKKNIGKVVLDGTENWEALSSVASGTTRFRTSISAVSGQNNSVIVLSPTFKGLSWQNIYLNDTTTQYAIGIITEGNWLQIRIPSTDASDSATFKIWLGNNNTTAYYVLATPTYTQITGTLETQLENVYQKLLSYTGQTNISQVNNDLSFVLNVQAIEG